MSAWAEEDVPGNTDGKNGEESPGGDGGGYNQAPAEEPKGGTDSAPQRYMRVSGNNKPGEVHIHIDRDSTETIGINLDVTDCVSLIVVDIFAGAIKTWNDAHPHEINLQVNDRIVGANGASGDSDKLLTALK